MGVLYPYPDLFRRELREARARQKIRGDRVSLIDATFDFDRSGCHYALIVV